LIIDMGHILLLSASTWLHSKRKEAIACLNQTEALIHHSNVT
jgi:hypothetical protein